jgi:hypothetical protein
MTRPKVTWKNIPERSEEAFSLRVHDTMVHYLRLKCFELCFSREGAVNEQVRATYTHTCLLNMHHTSEEQRHTSPDATNATQAARWDILCTYMLST